MSWLTVTEAAKYLHTREECIREALASGELDGRIPRHKQRGIIINTADLDAYVYGTYEPVMSLNAAKRIVARSGR